LPSSWISRAAKVAALAREIGIDAPIFLGLEGFDFLFALHDQAQGHALHAAGGTRAGSLRHKTGDRVKPTR
jgi:hypothetical protein